MSNNGSGGKRQGANASIVCWAQWSSCVACRWASADIYKAGKSSVLTGLGSYFTRKPHVSQLRLSQHRLSLRAEGKLGWGRTLN